MDRREALKRIAAGSTVALGITEITSSHAFADGGTVVRRPTNCATTPTTTVLPIVLGGNYIQLTVSAVVTTCPTGGTPQPVQFRYRSNNTVRSDAAPATIIANVNTWSNFTSSVLVVRITSATSQTNLPAGTVTIDVMRRRTCANGTRRAWCCVQRQRSGTWTGLTWGGSFATVATDPAGCDTPAPT